jgi:hypothetical protein
MCASLTCYESAIPFSSVGQGFEDTLDIVTLGLFGFWTLSIIHYLKAQCFGNWIYFCLQL